MLDAFIEDNGCPKTRKYVLEGAESHPGEILLMLKSSWCYE